MKLFQELKNRYRADVRDTTPSEGWEGWEVIDINFNDKFFVVMHYLPDKTYETWGKVNGEEVHGEKRWYSESYYEWEKYKVLEFLDTYLPLKQEKSEEQLSLF